MRILKVEPGEQPQIVDIDNTLSSLQDAVGGYIQVIYPFDDPVAIICDDEGKMKCYPPNRVLRDEDGDIYDILVGTFLIVGLCEDDFMDLTDILIDKYMAEFGSVEYFLVNHGKVVMLDAYGIHFCGNI